MIDERRPRTPPDRFGDRPPRDFGDRPRGGFQSGTRGPGFGGGGLAHSVRLRDGDRELEVSGSADFVRQILADVPTLLARLRGEAAPRTSIAMPPPPAERIAVPAAATEPIPEPEAPRPAGEDLERRILKVLRQARGGLSVLQIRQRLGDDVSGQQVRRVLERRADVSATGERPASYRLN